VGIHLVHGGVPYVFGDHGKRDLVEFIFFVRNFVELGVSRERHHVVIQTLTIFDFVRVLLNLYRIVVFLLPSLVQGGTNQIVKLLHLHFVFVLILVASLAQPQLRHFCNLSFCTFCLFSLLFSIILFITLATAAHYGAVSMLKIL